MTQSYSDNDKIYSVDMMFAFVYVFSPKTTQLDVNDYISVLDDHSWGDPLIDMYSPNDVLKNKEKYKKELKRINEADLSYPIMIHANLDEKGKIYGGSVVDGIHRLTKAVLNKKEHINAYIFDDKLMSKFLVDDQGDWDKVDKMEEYQRIALFNRRFYKFDQKITLRKYDRIDIISSDNKFIKVKTRLDELYKVAEPVDGKGGFDSPDFKNEHKLFVCYINDTIEAFMVLFSIEQYKNDDNFEDQGGLKTGVGAMLTSVCGSPAFKGHIHRLMKIIKKYSKKKFDYVLLHVSEERPGVEKAYATEGFKKVKNYVPSGSNETLHVMIYKIINN
jgi:hypothetical protein